MAAITSPSIDLDSAAPGIRVTTGVYTLEIRNTDAVFCRSPYARISGPDGHSWTDINLLASVHTAAGPDETYELALPVVRRDGENVEVIVPASSTAWNTRETRLVCTPTTVELSVAVSGVGSITDVTLFGGRASLVHGASGAFRSRIDFESVLVPVPTEPVQLVRPARSAAVLGVVGDADPGRLNGIFSPPPLVFGLGRQPSAGATDVPDGDWLGLSLREAVRRMTFTTMRYEPLDGGFHVRLSYEGHTAVDGEWVSPTLVLRPSATGWGVLDDYRADLVASGFAPAGGPRVQSWWREPIFCGWGAQCARAAHDLHSDGTPADPVADTDPETGEEENVVVRLAPSFATQEVYDEFLVRLDEHDLDVGTIVIDDRWQAEYGAATVDELRWPDLKAWIALRHAEGRKVLLWWKAWDPEGVPADECVTDAAGHPLSVDPANPAYLARLGGIVERLLGADGLDADGFKVDFTQRSPSGQTLSAAPGPWGIAALHAMLATLYTTAKAVKPDSLVICHTVHPSFGDVCDMVRLNDVLEKDIHGAEVPVVDQLVFRHAVATRTLPNHVIDTDQWPMPDRSQWLQYVAAQGSFGVPALYYLEAIDRSGERIHSGDLELVADSWNHYRETLKS